VFGALPIRRVAVRDGQTVDYESTPQLQARTDDLGRLRRIGHLLAAGVNLAGIAMVLGLETENAELRANNEQD
jgi:hypothetical protein